MSDAMGSALIGAILGGIKGGADANLDTIKQEAEQERKMSYAKLMQQYAQDNTMLQDRLATARQNTADDRADKRTESTREYEQTNALIADKMKEADANKLEAKQWELEGYKATRADALADKQDARADARLSRENNKPGELGRMYDDLLRINGGDVEKTKKQFDAYAASKTAGSGKGSLTQDQAIKIDGELRQEWEASKQPGQPFEAWALLNRPKAAAALGITSADETKNEIFALSGKNKGIVESEMSDTEIEQKAKAAKDNQDKKEASKWKPSTQSTNGVIASQSTTNTETPLTREQAVMAQNIAAEKNITFKEAVGVLLEKLNKANEESRQKGGQGITQTR